MIRKIDHLVITTADPKACLTFYEALGFRAVTAQGRFELHAGDFKINVHRKGHELEPKAAHVQTGSADLCLELDISMEDCLLHLNRTGLETESDVVPRNGVRGPMQSVYLRDPDGNLVELCCYS